eukprot:scaffold29115_cov56-Attheya_sp.AAC.2
MQQENLLQDLNRELKEIKEQLKAITISLENKSKSKNDDEKSSADLQARGIAREWSEKRTEEKDDKKRKIALNSVDTYGFYSYNIHRLGNISEGFDSTSDNESRDGRHNDQATKISTTTKNEDDDKVLTQRLEQLYDDGKRKNEVPLFYGGDAEAIICTVQEFDEVADDLEFTEAHEKFTNFRKCLRNVARDDWDTAKVGQAITIAGKLMILPEDIYEAQKNYFETVKKPSNEGT